MPASAATRRPTVLILCPTAWGVRNIALSGVLESLRASLRVHLLTTAHADSAVSERWGDADDPEMLTVTDHGAHRTHDLLRVLQHAAFAERHGIRTHRIFDRWRRRDQSRARRLWSGAVRGLAVATARGPVYEWLGRAERHLGRRRWELEPIMSQLRSLEPRLIVSTSCVVRDEAAYLLAAERLGIPTLGCILSFDNLTSKGVLPTFDHYAVWSDRMRQEVRRLYPDRDPASIRITGTTQFDVHRRQDLRWSRARTLEELGLTPDDRYVLYAANCATYTPTEPELIREYLRGMRSHPVLHRHRLVVRPHPADDAARWNGLADAGDGLVLSRPHAQDGRFSSESAQARLIGSLAHADVCVNMASTMTLDAAVLDTPVVCVAFAARAGSLEHWLAGSCYETSHYAPIAASGGVRVARSMDALVQETAEQVLHPEHDRLARARLVADLCGPVDGASADRLAGLIRSLAGADVPAATASGGHTALRGGYAAEPAAR